MMLLLQYKYTICNAVYTILYVTLYTCVCLLGTHVPSADLASTSISHARCVHKQDTGEYTLHTYILTITIVIHHTVLCIRCTCILYIMYVSCILYIILSLCMYTILIFVCICTIQLEPLLNGFADNNAK